MKPVVLFFLFSSFLFRSLGSPPPYINSIVSTDFDFILDTDPSTFESLEFVEMAIKEMPGLSSGALTANAYIYQAAFSDDTRVQIWAHDSFASRDAARIYAETVASAIGQQPKLVRSALNHVVLHTGDSGAFAEELTGFFVIYEKNIDTRVANHDLQETVFHEGIHVALEHEHASSAEWLLAQASDPGFITEYAEERPTKEDVPESAIFAWALLNHPGRLPQEVEAIVRAQMPSRIEYFRRIPGFVTRPNSATFEAWIESHRAAASSDFDAAITADPDNDGVNNLLEYLFGRHPLVSEGIAPVGFRIEMSGTDGSLRYSLSYRENTHATDYYLQLLGGNDLNAELGPILDDFLLQSEVLSEEDGGTLRSLLSKESVGSENRSIFIRLKAASR